MPPRIVVHSLLRVGFAGVLLLSSGGRLLAQDADVQPADSAETAAMPMGAEFSEESAASSEADPNAAMTDGIEEDRGDTSTIGPAAAEDPSEFDAIDNPEIGSDSTTGGPEVGENGEMIALPAGDHRLFIPSIITAGPPESADMAAVMDPAAAELDTASAPAAMSGETAAAAGGAQVASSQSVMGDFNGDGASDLAVGVP